ncbi:sugar transferase [Atopococcus tabaci]|uniref:sugar transferase n=1 Tax=Atopococcus tabaci TaxID=269774 RepID=UPI00041969C5
MESGKESVSKELITYSNEKITYEVATRILDIVLSLLGIVFLIPLLLVISIWIKLDDPKGNVIFSQTRVGKNGEPFKMYKFRSMYSDAEQRLANLLHLNEAEGAMFKMKEDPRVTKIGKFIRKTSIDELPQLFNVIKGEMSLVGPRPALPREVQEYSEYDRQRLQVTPGITGLWQVSGRSALTFEEMLELDLQFIRNRKISGYIKILFRTMIVVLKLENAY